MPFGGGWGQEASSLRLLVAKTFPGSFGKTIQFPREPCFSLLHKCIKTLHHQLATARRAWEDRKVVMVTYCHLLSDGQHFPKFQYSTRPQGFCQTKGAKQTARQADGQARRRPDGQTARRPDFACPATNPRWRNQFRARAEQCTLWSAERTQVKRPIEGKHAHFTGHRQQIILSRCTIEGTAVLPNTVLEELF